MTDSVSYEIARKQDELFSAGGAEIGRRGVRVFRNGVESGEEIPPRPPAYYSAATTHLLLARRGGRRRFRPQIKVVKTEK